jgi:hypothetical protein
LLNLYPGEFQAGLSQLSIVTPAGTNIVAHIALDPVDDTQMTLTFDPDTIPGNTVITSDTDSRGTIDAIINPETFDPRTATTGVRYLILEGINDIPEFGTGGYTGPVAWKNSDHTDFKASANDIIQWDGAKWVVIFNSLTTTDIVYITNSYTGIQYIWENQSWKKSFEGIYSPEQWSLTL